MMPLFSALRRRQPIPKLKVPSQLDTLDVKPPTPMSASSQTTFMDQLPTELLLLITAELERRDVLALRSTSRVMRIILAPLLYTTIRIPYGLDPREVMHNLAQTFSRHPQFASLTRTFECRPVIDFDTFDHHMRERRRWSHSPPVSQPPHATRDSEAYGDVLCQVFSAMINLKHLHTISPELGSSDNASTLIRAFAQLGPLVSLTITAYWQLEHADYLVRRRRLLKALLSCLRQQSQLEHLSLYSFILLDDEALSPTIIPRLNSLHSTIDDASSIIPQHPVSRLSIPDCAREGIQQKWEAIGRSSVPITELTWEVTNLAVFPENLKYMVANLPHIETLTILNLEDSCCPTVSAYIPLLNKLHTLNLHAYRYVSQFAPGSPWAAFESQISATVPKITIKETISPGDPTGYGTVFSW